MYSNITSVNFLQIATLHFPKYVKNSLTKDDFIYLLIWFIWLIYQEHRHILLIEPQFVFLIGSYSYYQSYFVKITLNFFDIES